MRRQLTEHEILCAQRLRRIWDAKKKALGLTQELAGERLGMTQGAVGQYLNGRVPMNLETKIKFAELLDVGVEEIDDDLLQHPTVLSYQRKCSSLQHLEVNETGLGLDTTPLGEPSRPRFIDIPVFDVELAAGNGTHIDVDRVTEFFPISENRLREAHVPPDQAAVVKVRGDSMESTLQDGDIVLVDTSIKRPVSGKIFAFAFDEELRVKRFTKRLDGSWRISSDNEGNPAYQDEIVSNHNIQQLRLIGQVKTLLERKLG